MKNMKNNIKRILATLCCVTLLVTGLSVSGWMKDTALAGDVRGTISIATGDVGYANSFGHINVAYTGMPSDYGRGIDFLDKEFVNKCSMLWRPMLFVKFLRFCHSIQRKCPMICILH